MANICKNLENTGAAKICVQPDKPFRRIILVPRYDADVVINSIANEAGVTKTALQAKFQHATLKSRFFPLPNCENVVNERAEPNFHEYESGNMEFTHDGKRTVEFFIPAKDAPRCLLKKLNKSWTYQNMGFFGIDTDGNFHYLRGPDGLILPIYIEEESFRATWVNKKYKEPAGIKVKFNYHSEVNDGDIRVINFDNLDFDGRSYDDVYGLHDVTITEVSNTLTTIIVSVVFAETEHPVTGYDDVADWYLYNTTDSAELTPSGVTESTTTPGTYTLTFDTQTASDAYSLNLVALSGFDPDDIETGTLTE